MSKQSAHTHLVKTLYRQVLKSQLNWTTDRELWMEQARQARAKFEAGGKLTDAGAIRSALRSAQTWLHDHIHPEPITNIYNYGGLAFQRDAPYPLHTVPPEGVKIRPGSKPDETTIKHYIESEKRNSYH